MRKRLVFALVLGLLIGLAGCSARDDPQQLQSTAGQEETAVRTREEMTVGISLPDGEDKRWTADGEDLGQRLEALGYQVRLVYAENDPLQQASQLQALTQEPVDCLVIAPVDSAVLVQAEQTAKEAKIPIVAYDRLLMDTDGISGYISFDNKAMGRAIAEYIVRTKKLDAAAAGESHTIEFFMGSPEDNNALQMYQGIMGVLQPYLESGVLVCRTGRTAFEDTCIVGWQEQEAKENCAGYLTEYYAEEKLDICCTVSDSFAAGCIAALEEAGYTLGADWPLITGQDGSASEELTSGKQAMTICKDTGLLAEQCAAMVDAVLTGAQPTFNDTESCHNNVMVVPAYLYGFEVKEGTYPPETPQSPPTETTAPVPTQ